METCVVRIFRRDAELLAREFDRMEELHQVVKRNEEYIQINLVGSMYITKVFSSQSKRGTTLHTYYLYGSKDEVSSVLSRTCGRRVRGCFIPIPEMNQRESLAKQREMAQQKAESLLPSLFRYAIEHDDKIEIFGIGYLSSIARTQFDFHGGELVLRKAIREAGFSITRRYGKEYVQKDSAMYEFAGMSSPS